MKISNLAFTLLIAFSADPALAVIGTGTTDVATSSNYRNFNDVHGAFCTGTPPPIGTPDNECFALSSDGYIDIRISWPGIAPPFDTTGLTGKITSTTTIPFIEVLPTTAGTMDIGSLGMAINDAAGFNGSSYFGAIELHVLDVKTHDWRYVTTWRKTVGTRFSVYFNAANRFSPLVKGILGYRMYGTQGTERFTNGMATLVLR